MNTAIFTAVCLASAALIVFVAMVTPNEEMVLVLGSPGSGKSVGSARDAVEYPGTVVILDPAKDSLARLVLMHDPSPNILFDSLSDLEHPLGYDLLKPSRHPNPERRRMQNQLRIQAMVEIMMRRGGGDLASTPLKEEWLTAALLCHIEQVRPKPLAMLPFLFMPGTAEFDAYVRDCSLPEIRFKFQQIAKLSLRGLRSEVGSAARLVSAVFRSPAFLARCNGGFDLGAFLQSPRARLIIERGDEIDEDATRTIIGGINVLVTEWCETRPKPYPPVKIKLDECTNAKTAGKFEEKKAGLTRKNGLTWEFLCQHPNFPGGPDGYYQNCAKKLVYQTSDYDLARKMATFAEPGFPPTDESRTERVAMLTAMMMNFRPGERLVISRSGSRIEKVPMLENPWPAWPGLREAKLMEKICRIYTRPEYRQTISGTPPIGGDATPPSSSSSDPAPSPPPTSPGSSPAERFKRDGKKPPSGSADSGGEDGSE